MRAPDFWSRDDVGSRILARVLSPLGFLYGASVAFKAVRQTPYRPRARVVCVGGLTVGGSGKTPIAIAITGAILEKGLRPVFLTRGYGGSVGGPLWVKPDTHTSREVGDEPLLLARTAPVVVARDRRAGAKLADGCDIIVMDDGHQNFQLAKDFSIVVIDTDDPIGNGRVLPAGPLREPPAQALARAHAVVLLGKGSSRIPHFRGRRLRASLAPDGHTNLKDERFVAFAGIGRPRKFFETLSKAGANLVDRHTYADHHAYTAADIEELKTLARQKGARLITTEKDFVRIPRSACSGIEVLPVTAIFEDEDDFRGMIDAIVGHR